MLVPLLWSAALAADPSLPDAHPCRPFAELPTSMACDAPQPRGHALDAPLQWGPMAFGSLWRGWLVCPDGQPADAQRRKGASPIPAEASPANPLVTDGADPNHDLIDAWTITCPGQPPLTWYVNGYRCGDPCPPDGLRVTPGPVADLFLARDTSADGARAEDLLIAAADVTQRFPDFEVAWLSAYHVWREQRRFPDALTALGRLEGFRPLTRDESAVRGLMALFTGDVDLARAAATASRDGATEKEHVRLMTCVIGAADAVQAQRSAPGAGFDGWCDDGVAACCEGKKKKRR